MWTKHLFGRRDNLARHRGTDAERRAEDYLLAQGLALKERNYRCKLGEIDLIMRDGESLVFVEVRYRKSTHFGSPAETVNHVKQAKLVRAAQHYLQRNKLLDVHPCRFDVISIAGPDQVDWFQNAF